MAVIKKVTKGGKAVKKEENQSNDGSKMKGIGRIEVPENMSGGDLRLLPEGPAKAAIEKVMLGLSKANKPKATIKYTILEEMDDVPDGQPTTVGEAVLESFSLQPQAIWKLNDLYKTVTGENLPHGDFGPEEFEAMLNDSLSGAEFTLYLEQQTPPNETEPRTTVVRRELA